MKRERRRATASVAIVLLALAGTTACRPPKDRAETQRPILRLGVSNAPTLATERGTRAFVLNMTGEGLLRVNQEGRVEPWLAESWVRSADGLSLTIHLRPGVTFHDGTPADAPAIATILNQQLRDGLKSAADDVDAITAKGDRDVEVAFRQPSALFADALMDVFIVKPGTSAIATGAFMAAPAGQAPGAPQMVAYDGYYLGKPRLGGVLLSSHASVRAAWAEMLRGQLDMLYEVGTDAIDAMRSSTNVSLYSFDRPYQYTIFINTRHPKLKAPAIRQALNQAIDREAIVRDTLGGNGTPSAGPVSPKHWAFQNAGSTFAYAPQEAAAKLGKPVSLKLVTMAEPPFEQLALAVKQQLKQVGIDLQIEQVGVEQVFAALGTQEFELVLSDASSGWGLIRPYRWWHSRSASNRTKFASQPVDSALDRVAHAASDDEYRAAVKAFQQAVADDPPAIFLAWNKRMRAISTRFDVKQEPGRDILFTLRNWRRAADNQTASYH